MSATETPRSDISRQLRPARVVVRCSLRYLARNIESMERWERLVFPVAMGVFLALAFIAPATLSDDTIRDMSPHTPINVR